MKECNCPICGHKIKPEIYFENGIGIVEETLDCDYCNYRYFFAYGTYQESFGNHDFIWGYTLFDDNNKTHRFFKKINRARFMERRNYRKGLRKYKKGETNG